MNRRSVMDSCVRRNDESGGGQVVATVEGFAVGTGLRRCDEHLEKLDAPTDNFVLFC